MQSTRLLGRAAVEQREVLEWNGRESRCSYLSGSGSDWFMCGLKNNNVLLFGLYLIVNALFLGLTNMSDPI